MPDGSGSDSAIVGHLEILIPTHQPSIRCYSCSVSVTKEHIKIHMSSAESYSVTPNNKNPHICSVVQVT